MLSGTAPPPYLAGEIGVLTICCFQGVFCGAYLPVSVRDGFSQPNFSLNKTIILHPSSLQRHDDNTSTVTSRRDQPPIQKKAKAIRWQTPTTMMACKIPSKFPNMESSK